MVTDNQIFEFRWNFDEGNAELPILDITDIWEIALQAYSIRNDANIWVTVYFEAPAQERTKGKAYADKIHIYNDLSVDLDSITEGTNDLLWHYAHLIQETAKTIGKLSTLMSLEPSIEN